jgi:hypothetical protein
MIINFVNQILGHLINTRTMTVSTLLQYLSEVLDLLTHWHNRRKSFSLHEIETLVGKLNHIALSTPWLTHLLSHLYTSIMTALRGNREYLIHTSPAFRNYLKLIKAHPASSVEEMTSTFAQANVARAVHTTTKKYFINKTMHEELKFIKSALECPRVQKSAPIAHLIPRGPDAEAWGDSSLDAAGGFSLDMGFWWCIEWPLNIRQRTLRHVSNGTSGKLIDINCLEYATILINYAASTHYWCTLGNTSKKKIDYPTTLIWADNTTADTWTRKGCKRSLIGRSLGQLQSALMINNPVGINTNHITTHANIIADKISRHKSESDSLLHFHTLSQEFPSLKGCLRFLPSHALLSAIMDSLLSAPMIDPLSINAQVLNNPGRIVT